TGARLPPVSAARPRQRACRVGYHVHRPQSPEAGTQQDSVLCVADERGSSLSGVKRRGHPGVTPPTNLQARAALVFFNKVDGLLVRRKTRRTGTAAAVLDPRVAASPRPRMTVWAKDGHRIGVAVIASDDLFQAIGIKESAV